METEKSRDLHSAIGRARRANGISSILKISRFKTQKEMIFQFKSKGMKKPMYKLSSQARGAPAYSGRVSLFVLFQTSTDWMRPNTLGRAICLTQFTNLDITLRQKHPHRYTQKMIDQIAGRPMAQSD